MSITVSLGEEQCHGSSAGTVSLRWIFAAIMLFFTLIICSGNGLVILVFLRSPKLRTMTNFYIIQLAVADFSLGLTLPFNVAVMFEPQLVLVYSVVCALRYSLYLMFGAASIFSLTALTYDRYLAITDPLRYHDVMTLKRYVINGAMIWSPAVVVGLIIPAFWHRPFASCPRCGLLDIFERDYFRYIIVPTFTAVSLFMVGLYMRIFSIARRQMKTIADMDVGTPGHSQESKKKSSLQQEMKLIKAGLTVFAAFYITFLPFFIIISIQMYGGIHDNPGLNTGLAFSSMVLSINSCINPVIYTYKLPAFKTEVKNMFHMTTSNEQNSNMIEMQTSKSTVA